MIQFIVYGGIGIGILALIAGWTLIGYWPVSVFLLILTPFILYLVKRKFETASGIALALGVIAAALGVSFGMALPYALIGVLTLLIAWDLDGYSRRLAFASPADGAETLQARHLLWLGMVVLLGLGLSLFVLNVHLQFNFELAVGLAVLVFVSLTILLGWLMKKER